MVKQRGIMEKAQDWESEDSSTIPGFHSPIGKFRHVPAFPISLRFGVFKVGVRKG